MSCDDNGAWTMKGNREKLYCVTKNFEGQVSLRWLHTVLTESTPEKGEAQKFGTHWTLI